MGNQAVQVLIVWSLNTQVSTANIVDCLIVDHEAAVGMFQGGVSGQDGIVWLNDRGGDLGGRIDAEFQLALLAIVHRETLHEKGAKPGTCSTAERVKHQESLKTRAVVGNATNLVQHLINQLLPNSVMTASIVVGRIFLSSNHLLGMEKAAICARSYFVHYVGFEIAVDGAGNILALAYSISALALSGLAHGTHAYQSRRRRC